MVSVLALSASPGRVKPKTIKIQTQHVGLVQSGPHHYLIKY